MSNCIVFVGNMSSQADEAFLRRLFAAYGGVKNASLVSDAGGYKFGLIEYGHVDDADSAIASLHLRYCMAPGVPVICLYDKSSNVVSDYGREVGAAYREAVQSNRDPLPVPLETFDKTLQRSSVNAPTTDLRPHAAQGSGTFLPQGQQQGGGGHGGRGGGGGQQSNMSHSDQWTVNNHN